MSAGTWESIGTIVGNASTSEFTFILKSFKSHLGDIVAVTMEVPSSDRSGVHDIIAWGRITGIERFNPFFPYEAAQELAHESMALLDTVLSNSRDHLQARVLVLGFTADDTERLLELYPLTYPVPPAAEVRYPPATAIAALLTATVQKHTPLKVGTLIARDDVEVELSAERIAARHLAILAMTGGGKTVAARRILRELIDIGYPLMIFDPHGDYLGLWENRHLFGDTTVKLFYPHLIMTDDNRRIVGTLIMRMTDGMTEPQQDFFSTLLTDNNPKAGEPVRQYIEALMDAAQGRQNSPGGNAGVQRSTINAVRRSLKLVHERLTSMEKSNTRLRAAFKDLEFEELPDPEGAPEQLVRPRQVSILYLGGYDHLTQSTIVSIVMEALFNHRLELADRIAPFLAVIEEAHNFVPSAREGIEDTPSLITLRKVITEGRKFGTGLILITQRPSRVDETILSQCNSFLVMRLVNPKDQTYVRSVMENLPDSDARMLPAFGPGQGIISGQAVRFPLLVKIRFDDDLVGSRTMNEDFIAQAAKWKEDPKASGRASVGNALLKLTRKARRLKHGS